MSRKSQNSVHSFDHVNFAVLHLDRQSVIHFINPVGMKLLGNETAAQIVGQPLRAMITADQKDLEALEAVLADPESSRSTQQVELDLLRSDGQHIPMIWNVEWPESLRDKVAPIHMTGFDLTLIRQNQEIAALFQRVIENQSGGIVITNNRVRILYANPAAMEISGFSSDELLGRTPAVFKSGKTPNEVYAQLRGTIERGEVWRGEFINRRKDGDLYIEGKTIAAIRDASGAVQYYFAIGEDVSKRQQYEQKIDQLILFDQLTGLPNRLAFLRELTAAIESAALVGLEIALLHVDLDNFKKFHSGFGLEASELFIVDAAAHINGVLGESDMLAHLSEGEFAILIAPGRHGLSTSSQEIAEKILAAIRQPFQYADRNINVTASIGIACYPENGETPLELLANAINATFKVKSAGGNAVSRYEATMAEAENWRRDLPQAIARGEMTLHYQPQVSLMSGNIIGLEALIRWQHPQHGMIGPDRFIPLAEESDQIIAIGEWVLNEVCRQMRVWIDSGLPPIKVAVNLAARHFRMPDLPDNIASSLNHWKLDARFLEIEITESAMMQDMGAAIRNMGQLKSLGVRISLDDFGTGYSSMAYLSRFPIDVVKIDQSFVRDITTNPANAAIAQATIAMSHKLGKTVLAEGVEKTEQMLYLRRCDCDEMQGFLFSRPLPVDEITNMLQQDVKMNITLPQTGQGEHTILIVDDEANILSALRRVLRREGYTILSAESPAAAFSLLAQNPVQLVISDQRMPEMSGTDFLSQVKGLYPETVRMVLSAYSEIATVTDAINKGAAYRFLTKPWNDEQIKEEIRGALRHWRELYGKNHDTDDTALA
jgi:diguanylate cyclase (GGDEF)-like protein/PAS domain S-box-containing protein